MKKSGQIDFGIPARYRQELESLRADLSTLRAENERLKVGWRCFHCDEVFTDAAAAREHFGRDEGKTPACFLDVASVKRVRELEEEIEEVRAENRTLDNDARLWHEHDADRVRRIGNRQWWQEIDYREGEKIVLMQRVEAAESALTAQRDAIRALAQEMRAYVEEGLSRDELGPDEINATKYWADRLAKLCDGDGGQEP